MIKCEALVEALNGEYKGTYESFENCIVSFVEACMRQLCNDRYYFPLCWVSEELSSSTLGRTTGTSEIELNKKVIDDLMQGDIKALIVIFHELSHIDQNIQIKNGVITPNIIRYIKDKLLNIYQASENRRYGLESDTPYKFYKKNYMCDSGEIDANLNAILLTVCFLKGHNIDFRQEEFEKIFNKFISMKEEKRYVGDCVIFNDYHLTLDEAFDCAIKYNPDWLDIYPQLKAEYYVEDGVIKRREHVIYEDYDEDDDVCHKFRQLVRQR